MEFEVVEPPTPRRRIRWYHRFMDWLWFGPLTRDLRPYCLPERAERGNRP